MHIIYLTLFINFPETKPLHHEIHTTISTMTIAEMISHLNMHISLDMK